MRSKKQKDVLLALGFYDYRLHKGAARFAMEHGWHLSSDLARQQQIPKGWTGDGILSKITSHSPLARFVKESGLPVVNVGRGGGGEYAQVLIDEEAIVDLAFEHFQERGFENFAWYGKRPENFFSKRDAPGLPNRAQLFLDRVREAGFDCEIWDIEEVRSRQSFTWNEEQRWLYQRVTTAAKPIAVLCFNDILASNLIYSCVQNQISVPHEVAVIGDDNDPLVCEANPVKITSIDTDMEQRAYIAASKLHDLISGKDVSAKTYVKPKGIVARKSTDTLVIKHPEVAQALKFIWSHYHREIKVSDINRNSSYSARGLHKAFIQELGRSPLDELRRVRLLRARDLLTKTDLDLEAIVERTGFPSAKSLYRAYGQFFGNTPIRFRKTYQSVATGPERNGARSVNGHLPETLLAETASPVR